MQVYKIDEEGFFIESIILSENENLPEDCVDVGLPNGFYRPKWDGGKWIEGMSQDKIEQAKLDSLKPSQSELKLQAITFAVQKLIRIDELTEEEYQSVINLYEEHKPDIDYRVGDIVRYGDKLYRIVQEHTSQDDWTPSELPALYTKVIPHGFIEEWGERDLTVNPFMIGDKVIFEGEVYKSIIDNNVWSPTEYQQGWELITP